MKFHVSYSNVCGNCVLVISTDYDGGEAYIKQFYFCAC